MQMDLCVSAMIMRYIIISILSSLALVNMVFAIYNTGYYGYVPIGIGHGGYGGYNGNSFGGGSGSIIMSKEHATTTYYIYKFCKI